MSVLTTPLPTSRIDLTALDRAELAPIEQLLVAARTIPDPAARRRALAKQLAAFPDAELADLAHNWRFQARPDQLVPDDDDWSIYAWIAGRGSGKTRSGSEWVRNHVRTARPGPKGAGVLIGATAADVRDLMVEQGPSALLTISPEGERPRYEPSKRLLTWPNGAIAFLRSAADPEDIRGLSVAWAWVDEPAKFRYLQETWDNLRFALREGEHPRTIVTGTPKPVPLIRKIMRGELPRCRMAPRVSTFRNWRLPPDQLDELELIYAGTRLGQQELDAVLLEEVEGALWTWVGLEAARWQGEWVHAITGVWQPALPPLARKVTAVDPPGSSTGAECGIVVAGVDRGKPPTAYVLDDRSIRGSPAVWGRAALHAYFDSGSEVIVAEKNYGGEMVENTIRTVPAEGAYPSGAGVRFRAITAKGSKEARANPVSSLYEKTPSRVVHVGRFPLLEDQMTSWVPGETPDKASPDRVDALVHAVSELLVLHPSVGVTTRTGRQVAAARLP